MLTVAGWVVGPPLIGRDGGTPAPGPSSVGPSASYAPVDLTREDPITFVSDFFAHGTPQTAVTRLLPGTETPASKKQGQEPNPAAYNCFALAFHGGAPIDDPRYVQDEPEKPRWDNHPDLDLADSRDVPPGGRVRVGDAVFYGSDRTDHVSFVDEAGRPVPEEEAWLWQQNGGTTSLELAPGVTRKAVIGPGDGTLDADEASHAGVVVAVDGKGDVVLVASKEGENGITLHAPDRPNTLYTGEQGLLEDGAVLGDPGPNRAVRVVRPNETDAERSERLALIQGRLGQHFDLQS